MNLFSLAELIPVEVIHDGKEVSAIALSILQAGCSMKETKGPFSNTSLFPISRPIAFYSETGFRIPGVEGVLWVSGI